MLAGGPSVPLIPAKPLLLPAPPPPLPPPPVTPLRSPAENAGWWGDNEGVVLPVIKEATLMEGVLVPFHWINTSEHPLSTICYSACQGDDRRKTRPLLLRNAYPSQIGLYSREPRSPARAKQEQPRWVSGHGSHLKGQERFSLSISVGALLYMAMCDRKSS